jgi:large subunit ribosomal protein L23
MSIIIKPIVTEKVTKQNEVLNQFGFVVDRKANKVEIKKAVEAAYGVTIVSVKWFDQWKDKCLQKSNCSSTRRRNNRFLQQYLENKI